MDEEGNLTYDVDEAPILHRTFPTVRSPSNEKRAEFLLNYDGEIKMGPFSDEESEKIVSNFKDFLKSYDIQDGVTSRCALLGFKLEDQDAEETVTLLKQLIKPCGFYYRLAKDLPDRLLSSVYERARKILNPFRRQSNIDEKTKEEMIQYAKSCEQPKHIYAHMANKFNCEPLAVRKIVQRKTDLSNSITLNTGKFSRRETMRLLDSICKYFKIDALDLSAELLKRSEIPWSQIAKDVKTRHPDTCSLHARSKSLLKNLTAFKNDLIKWRSKKRKKEK